MKRITIEYPVGEEPRVTISDLVSQPDGSARLETWQVRPGECGWSDVMDELRVLDPAFFYGEI